MFIWSVCLSISHFTEYRLIHDKMIQNEQRSILGMSILPNTEFNTFNVLKR